MSTEIKPKSLRLNFFLNTSRTVLNFLIPLATFPYVSRILGPEGLGRVEFANSIVSYFVLFTALGIPTYGMREIARVRDDEELRSRTVMELASVLFLTSAAGYAVYFLLINFVPQFSSQKILFFIVAPTIFLSDFSFEWFYQGIENQTYITVRYIIIKIIQVTCIFLLIKNHEHFYRYAAISVGMNSLSTVFNILHLRKFVRFVPFKELHPLRHLKPVLIIFASIVAVNIYMHLDVTMVGFISGEEYVGLYTAANRVVRIVISLVTALSAVVVPRLENCLKNGDEENYKKYLNLSLHYILVLAVPCCLGIAALAPDIIALFAGKKYTDSVLTMRILCAIIFIVPLAHFTGMQVLYPHRMEWKYTVAVSAAAALNALCNSFLIPRFAQNGAAFATVIAEGTGLVLQMIFAGNLIKDSDLFSWNSAKYLASGLVMFAVLSFVPYVAGSTVIHLLLCMAVAVVVYGALLLLMREKLVMSLVRRGKNM